MRIPSVPFSFSLTLHGILLLPLLFERGWVLWLLPIAAGSAVLLHMIRPQAQQTNPFAPSFLAPSDPPTVLPSRRISDPWVMILRLLVLAVLVLAAAAPYRILVHSGGIASVLVIDGSFSMRRPAGQGGSLFEQALTRARRHQSGGGVVYFCADHLIDWLAQPQEGRADLAGCSRELAERGHRGSQLWLSDGSGREAGLAGDQAIEILAAAPYSFDSHGTIRREQSESGAYRLVNPLPWQVEVGPDHALCPADNECRIGIAGDQPLALHLSVDLFAPHPLDWSLPPDAGQLVVTVAAEKVERGSFGAGRLLREALLALHDQGRIQVRFAVNPDSLSQAHGIILYQWNSINGGRWQQELLKRQSDTVLWVIPGAELEDTMVPVSLDFAFGTYRGWLERPGEFVPPLPPEATSGITRPVSVRRRISLAETDQAVVVWRDTEEQPLVVWDKHRKVLLWTIGLDPAQSDLALTPWFVPALADLVARFSPKEGTIRTCVAGTPVGAMRCPGEAGLRTIAGVDWYVEPDWLELSGEQWAMDDRAPVGFQEERISRSPALMALALLLLAASFLPFARLRRARTLLLVVLLMPNWARAAPPEPLLVGLLPGLVEDPARSEAFQQAARQLERRGNIRLAAPRVWIPENPLFAPAFIWSNFCGIGEMAVHKAVQTGLIAVQRGIPWWIEDCGDPGEVTPAYREAQDQVARQLMAYRWQPVNSNHVVFKSYYLLSRLDGRFAAGGEKVLPDHGMPLIFFTPQDITGRIAYGGAGEYTYRSFVNVLYYLLMGDYKEDGIHVPYLLQRLQRTRR